MESQMVKEGTASTKAFYALLAAHPADLRLSGGDRGVSWALRHHHHVRYLLKQQLDRSYRQTQAEFSYQQNQSSSQRTATWYSEDAVTELVSRDAVELAMRHGTVVNQEDLKDQLPRIFAAKGAEDALLVYAFEDKQASTSSLYAFLIRNDVVVLSATKQPGDTHWSRKG